jgi:hypothetical protein
VSQAAALPSSAPPSRLNRGDVLHALQILVIIGALFAGWQAFKDTGADHGRRIVLLEEQKASKETVKANNELLSTLIAEQSKQIGELKEIVKSDHDSIVTLNARLNPPPAVH